MILIHCGINHYAVPSPISSNWSKHHICNHWQETNQTCGGPLITSLHCLVNVDLSECISEERLPFWQAIWMLNIGWNSRISSPSGSFWEFVSANSFIVRGCDVPTTVPICPNYTPDIVFKDFILSVNLTVCSALSSDPLPVIVDIQGQSSFQGLPHRPYFQDHLTDRLNENPRMDNFVKNVNGRLNELNSTIHETISASVLRRQLAKKLVISIPPAILATICKKNRLWGDW